METVLLLLLLGTWGGIFWVYRRLTREIDDLARERVEQTETQASLARMVTQLQEASDGLAQAMTARSGRLQALLEQADRRAADLEAALNRVQQAQVQARFQARAEEHAVPSLPVPPAIATPSANGNGAMRVPTSPRDSTREVGQVADAETHGNAHNGSDDEVRRLAALGLSPAEIAQRTHRGREEVRLLLQLMGRTPPTTAPAAQTNEGTTR